MARRGKRSRGAASTPAPAPPPVAESTPAAPARPAKLPPARVVGEMPLPAFWEAFEVPRTKLVVARIVVFGLLALDALLQIRHAPRYGTGFNVANLGFLDNLAPGRTSFVVAQLALAYLFVTAACGVATRVVVPIAAAVYSYLYFSSQLDSYQHHYLVAMVLVLASFVPWHSSEPRVRSWALRLILVQLALMYAWAAISKLDASWLDGKTLALQLGSSANIPHDKLSLTSRMIESTIGWATAAKLVVLVEATLAATVWHRRGWLVALPLGVLFHAGILFTDLDIGLFAQLMIAMYLLLVPDSLFARTTVSAPKLPRVVTFAVVVPALVLGVLTRYDHAGAITVVLAVAAVVATIRFPYGGVALLVTLLLATGVDRLSTVTIDYYRLWGGSARRLGHPDEAEQAYGTWVSLDPKSGEARWKLGRVLLERDDPDGLVELHISRDLDPKLARAYVEEARWLDRKGKRAEALEVVRAGLAVEPTSPEANALAKSLTGKGRPTRAPEDD